MTAPAHAFLDRGDGIRIAYRHRAGAAPTILFLPGYASDMDGAKAVAIDAFAAARGLGCLRLDYSGTGLSEGAFTDGTLTGWIDEALLLADSLTAGPLIVAGSSMGGWISLHLALRRPERVAAMLGIAAAPDFTDWGGPDGLTAAFMASGQASLLLDKDIPVICPVRLVHGERDADVPVGIAQRLMDQLRSADVQLTIIKNGGHRLSEPHEIAAILRALDGLLETL